VLQRTRKDLVVLFGPPAVGKMTVGEHLSTQTGYKMFHNHMTAELALHFHDFSDPLYGLLLADLRNAVFSNFLLSHHRGIIFTFTWDTSDPFGARMFTKLEESGYNMYFVELTASVEVLVSRNLLPDRIQRKPSKSDATRSMLDLQKRTTATQELFCTETLATISRHPFMSVSTLDQGPNEVAQKIGSTFKLGK
jgi:hypothetical protein